MFKKMGLAVLVCVLISGVVSSVALAKVPSTGIVDPPVAGASYTNLSKAATLGAIARIGGNVFKCVTNVSTFPAFQGEPAYLAASSADGYSVNNYIATSQFTKFEGIWYCSQYGSTTIEGALTGYGGVTTGGIGWIQIAGVANAWVTGEGANIVEFDYLAPALMGGDHGQKTSSDTRQVNFLARGGAAPTAAGNNLYYPYALDTKANTIVATNQMYKIYLGNRN